MRYILPADALSKLKTLRKDYEAYRKVDLSKEPSMISLPKFLGGTDVVNRNIQVTFIEKIIAAFNANLLEFKDIDSLPQRHCTLESYRTLIAACLFVQSQVKGTKSHSELYTLIREALGINATNFLDAQDKEACFQSAYLLLVNNPKAFTDANAALEKAELEPFSAKEWGKFTKYLQAVTQTPPPPNNWPITSITKPVFGMTFAYAGATVGFLTGEVVSNSTKIMSTKLQLTAVVGSSMIFLGSASPAGVAFIAPAIAAKLIDTFFRISLADILGFIMNIVGQGVGIGVGAPLDLAYRFLCCVCTMISQKLHAEPKNPEIDGLRIGDGKYMYQGVVLDLIPVENLPENYAEKGIQIKEDGTMLVKGKVVDFPSSVKQLPPEILEQLRKTLSEKPKCVDETNEEDNDEQDEAANSADEGSDSEERAEEEHEEAQAGVALHP